MDDISGEVWRPVVGWEAQYSVSNLGRIRSEARVCYVRQEKPCGFSGCDWPLRKGGLCQAHYQQRRNGRPLTSLSYTRADAGDCSFPGCGRAKESSTGLCVAHVSQLKTHEELRPLGWVDAKIINGKKSKAGYILLEMYRAGKLVKRSPVHRLVLESFVGPCPTGMVARHLNDVKKDNRLVNLAYGTMSDNTQDCLRNGNHNMLKRSACKRGHEFTPENTKVRVYPGRRYRECQTCLRERQQKAS